MSEELINTQTANTFSSIDEAVKALSLDRRCKWQELNGELVMFKFYTSSCSGCACDCGDGYPCSHGNSGCHECGYHGNVRRWYPIKAKRPDGSSVKVVITNFK